MDLKEYMSVRRAYNIVRQLVDSSERLTFEEFAILCRLMAAGEPVKTSIIAEYQGALRPTMTHRINHLANLELIERQVGLIDRRNVVCSVTDKGLNHAMELASLVCEQIPTGRSLSRTTPERICKYVDAMGALFCKAGDLVLLGIQADEADSMTIMQLVDALGLLQPTVSMSVSTLVDRGFVARKRETTGTHTTIVSLTPEGAERAAHVTEKIEALVVRRKLRNANK